MLAFFTVGCNVGGSDSYTITIADSIEHGSVSADLTTAAAGESVTLTVTPADGYELEEITVKDADSAVVAVTQDTSDKSKYTFTMPESDVTVSATFTAIPTTTYTVTVASTIEHGTVTANPTTAAAGAKITLSATPESGYELSAYSVTDANGSAVTVSNNSFTMPESNVTVSATFTEATAGTGEGGSGGDSGGALSTPLTLEALTAGTIVVSSPKSGMQYTKNDSRKYDVSVSELLSIDVVAGDTVSFYGNGTSITKYNGTNIAGGDAEVKVYGNIMSLVDETGFATATALAKNAFRGLFDGNTKLKDASGLLLPATTLANYCYTWMFSECTSLTAAPALPATTLAENCYDKMFSECTSLTEAPALPAETLENSCYYGMFSGCTSLTEAPELPATTLADSCYQFMFYSCTSLSAVTCLATDVSASNCTNTWLSDAGSSVTGTKTFTTPKDTSWSSGVSGIPDGWTRVDSN